MKKFLIFAGLAALLVGIPLIAKITGAVNAKQVDVREVEAKLVRSSILASGALAFREQVLLRPEVIGQVIELHVEEADNVAKGVPVITLDPRAYHAQVKQAQARVRMQQIAIERQQLLVETLGKRFERQQAMFASNLTDEDSYDSMQSDLSLARLDLQSFQESLAQARAALEQAENLLSKTRITSPIDGVVIQVDVKVGETVVAGTTNIPGSAMMVIADPSVTLTEVQVDEADIGQVHQGQTAEVYTAAYPDMPLAGTVQSVASVARKTAGEAGLSFLVKILLHEQNSILIRPGMSVRADIYTRSRENTLAIPVQAVLYDEDAGGEDEQTYVFVMRDGKAVRRNVSVGIASDSDQEIIDGLEAGERVIYGPYRVLRHLLDGEDVKVLQDLEGDPR